MKITKEIAERNVGKYYDCFNRRCRGLFPRLIIKFPNGSLGFKRIIDGVCSHFDFESEFNAEHFDYMFEMIEEEE